MSRLAHYAWILLLDEIVQRGKDTSPRGLPTKEILGCKSTFDMNYPVIVASDRKLGYRFMCAEAAWILSGDNRVSSIKPFSKEIERFSDDGVFYFGAYGPRFRDQVRHVVSALIEDPDTRQAVVTLWRPNPPKSKDIPCTIDLHWFVRDGQLQCMADMRSSDVWLGVPYDWFNFTMMTAYVGLVYRQITGKSLGLGTMHFYAHSQHLYESNLGHVSNLKNPIRKAFESPFFDYEKFGGINDLVDHLWKLANKQPCQFTFMTAEMNVPVQ